MITTHGAKEEVAADILAAVTAHFPELGRPVTSVWDDVVGQPVAVDHLRRAAAAPVHAYLFVGPPGSTKDEAARAFGGAPAHRA